MSITQALMGLGLSILIARLLDPGERGLYALTFLVIGMAGFLANPGIYAGANYFLSSRTWSQERAVGSVLVLGTASSLIAAAFAGITQVLLSAQAMLYAGWPTLLICGGAAMYSLGISLDRKSVV